MLRCRTLLAAMLGVGLAVWAMAQDVHMPLTGPRADDAFQQVPPAIGSVIPELSIYDAQGKPLETKALRGNYTVLDFGCFT